MEILSLIGSCLPCIPGLSTPYLSLNGNQYKIIRLLGEGGFSYVYLVSQKSNSNSLYALKRIRCPFGSNDEAYKNAMNEIKNYHRFGSSKTPYIIQSIDETVIQEKDGSKTINILLPYFEKSLQDIINYKVLNNEVFEEEEMLRIFIGVCRGLQGMHKFKKRSRNTINSGGASGQAADSEEEADLLLPVASDDEDDGLGAGTALEMEELVPYAHRDIKPANVMLSAEGLPVLADLGSCSRARISVKSRQQALTLTDYASEHCTLPYRAPELIDVETNTEITEKSDIWSLGCLLYACCFGFSPFEKMEIEQGANLTVAVSSARYMFPNDTRGYSQELLDLIKVCLVLDSKERPTVDQLLETALEISRRV